MLKGVIFLNIMDRIALILTIIGGINWGAIGIFKFDIVAWIFRRSGRCICKNSLYSCLHKCNLVHQPFVQKHRCRIITYRQPGVAFRRGFFSKFVFQGAKCRIEKFPFCRQVAFEYKWDYYSVQSEAPLYCAPSG